MTTPAGVERTNPLDHLFIAIATLLLLAMLAPAVFGLGYGFGTRATGDRYVEGAVAMCLALAQAAEADMAQARAACPRIATELGP